MSAMADDPFDDLLNLEDQFYEEGFRQGSADGIRAGRIEGRSLGMEKGFEKFQESGRLQGRVIVWANRLAHLRATPAASRSATEGVDAGNRADNDVRPDRRHEEDDSGSRKQIPPLTSSARLARNVTMLYALVEPDTLSTENTDEAVNDFDDRIRRAQGKAKVIEKAVGEALPAGHRHSTASPESSEHVTSHG
ncbi:hypothetical protein VTK73DRAFT_6319 [Phialemonium thermophilum]|uniref:Essential protein Yae1 N-terminal domain-containing protein n=1 Tax=Phialemonium thermophilum TaxID=223376 RepID=A0ABR3WKE2_9PEZI